MRVDKSVIVLFRQMNLFLNRELLDDMVTRYADELTEAELLVSADVYDAIGMIRFDSEDSLAARQRIYGIASADDLHAILTGYFDPNDAAYTADTALDARLQAILAACGLNPEIPFALLTRQ